MKKMKTEFFMAMIPPTVTAQEHKVMVKNGKPVFYNPPEVKQAREKLTSHLAKFKPSEPYKSGVRLITKWCFPLWKTSGRRISHYKTRYRQSSKNAKGLYDRSLLLV